jgi:hypothetical protein
MSILHSPQPLSARLYRSMWSSSAEAPWTFVLRLGPTISDILWPGR